jgi:hypothetical protein
MAPLHGKFLEGVYEIELDTKTEYGGFRGHFQMATLTNPKFKLKN